MIESVSTVNNALHLAIQRLLPQLSPTAKIPSAHELEEIISSPMCHLFIAKKVESKEIIGILTLVIFRIPSGVRGWIEDIVVDISARGLGAGELLCHTAIAFAKKQGVLTLDLTSKPTREVANRLYQKLEFNRRETNVYRLKI